MKTKASILLGAALSLLVTFGGTHAAKAQGERIVFYGPVTETYGKGRNATTETHNQIHSMNVDGSDVVQLTSERDGCLFPSWSPDRSHILYHRGGTISTGGGIYIMDADGRNSFRVADAQKCSADWSPDGSMVCYVGHAASVPYPYGLWAVSVDPDAKGKKSSKVGTPVHLADGAGFWGPTWSPDGTRITYHTKAKVAILDLTTGVESIFADMPGLMPSWSPSGDQIAFASGSELHIMDADFTNVKQLTNIENAGVSWPRWSDDGKQVAFRLIFREGEEAGSYAIYKITLATGEVTFVHEWGDHPDWSPY